MAFGRLRRKLTVENLWLYILSMLRERPMYAYEIAKTLEEKFGFSTALVTVYVVLYKMRLEGLIKVRREAAIVGRPDRIYYEATDEGVKAFNNGIAFIREVSEKLA